MFYVIYTDCSQNIVHQNKNNVLHIAALKWQSTEYYNVYIAIFEIEFTIVLQLYYDCIIQSTQQG